jgi:putative RecB family exonuclease
VTLNATSRTTTRPDDSPEHIVAGGQDKSGTVEQPPVKLTPSRSEDFLACPLRYKRLHVDGLGPKDRPPSRHLSFGISLHDALRRFHEGGGPEVYGSAALSRLLDQSWVDHGYVDEDEAATFRTEALGILGAYCEAFGDEPTRHLGHELFVQAPFRLAGSRVLLSGKIDRLSVWPDGRLEVVDYKTSGGAPPSPEKLASDLAPFLYYTMARINYTEYALVDVTYLYLKTMTRVTARFDAEDQCPVMNREEVDLDEVL